MSCSGSVSIAELRLLSFFGTEVTAWQADRNQTANKVYWQFTTSDACIKFRRVYPEFLRRDDNLPIPFPTAVFYE